jgi:hypothetical protein
MNTADTSLLALAFSTCLFYPKIYNFNIVVSSENISSLIKFIRASLRT